MASKSFGALEGVRKPKSLSLLVIAAAICSCFYLYLLYLSTAPSPSKRYHRRPLHAEQVLQTCRNTRIAPGPPENFKSRTESDRYVPGTSPVIIRNATVWIGRSEGVYENADILLHKCGFSLHLV